MNYGGQAVIDGVMMRSKHHMAVAVRLDNGKITTMHEKIKFSFLSKVPLLRGVYNMYDMMKMGMRALNWSADQHLTEGEEEASGWINTLLISLTSVLSVIIALAIFKVVPFFLSQWVVGKEEAFLFNLLDGVIKLVFLLSYMMILSLFKETRKIFEYHGAEHKTLGCLEAKKDLSIENCIKYAKEHKRCGTNFLFFVIFVSILIYLFIPLNMAWYYNIALRIAFLPVIAGISYEILKFNSKYPNPITNLFSVPGILMQKLTTKEPDESQIEVGIVALKKVVELENNN